MTPVTPSKTISLSKNDAALVTAFVKNISSTTVSAYFLPPLFNRCEFRFSLKNTNARSTVRLSLLLRVSAPPSMPAIDGPSSKPN
jgi:hypothetical protein